MWRERRSRSVCTGSSSFRESSDRELHGADHAPRLVLLPAGMITATQSSVCQFQVGQSESVRSDLCHFEQFLPRV